MSDDIERRGEDQVAAELREIASETDCPQRKMHLEIAAQIVEQGLFSHPSTFGLEIELSSLRTENDRLRSAAQDLIASATDHYFKRNGHRASIEGTDGEKCWIVLFDAFEALRTALQPTPAAPASEAPASAQATVIMPDDARHDGGDQL